MFNVFEMSSRSEDYDPKNLESNGSCSSSSSPILKWVTNSLIGAAVVISPLLFLDPALAFKVFDKIPIWLCLFFFGLFVVFYFCNWIFRVCCDGYSGKGGGPYGLGVTRGQDLSGKDFSGKTLIQQDFKTVFFLNINYYFESYFETFFLWHHDAVDSQTS